jgi:hypothetical protein
MRRRKILEHQRMLFNKAAKERLHQTMVRDSIILFFLSTLTSLDLLDKD